MNNHNQQKISVIGLGYVGCVTSACLAYLKHNVIGVDIDQEKINLMNNGKPPIEEPLLAEYLGFGLKNKYLSVTSNLEDAINNSDITFVCVCTPPKKNGSCDLTYLINAVESIAKILKNKSQEHIIILRSTIPPGTTEDIIIPIIENTSGKKNNKDFYICFHPEFLREGTATHDFFNPPKYIIGENCNKHAGDRILELLLLNKNRDNIVRTNYKTAELVKYTDNVWHALKVSFANEIGAIADSFSVDSHELMQIFCTDKKLNISSYYLKPGLSYGGSCLPKDLEEVKYIIEENNLKLPLINSISISNSTNIKRTYDFIRKHAHGNVGWHGVSFKDNTDDLRNSVNLELISMLSKDMQVSVFDNLLNIENLTSDKLKILSNKIKNHQEIFVDDFIKLIDKSDTLVIGHSLSEFKNLLLQYPKPLTILDLTNNSIKPNSTHHNYHGLFW